MSRAERWLIGAVAAAGALAAGGCMRIYPDPELPDVIVEWSPEFDCAADSDRVSVSLSTIDPAAEARTATAACRDGSVRLDDVERVRYRLAAKLEDTAGAVLGGHDEEIDLRDGLNERVFAFFGRPSDRNFRVMWTFAMGASCASLGATSVRLRFSMPMVGLPFFFDAPCDAPVFVNGLPVEGEYTIDALAVALDRVVAVAPESAPFDIVDGEIADLGTLVLSPCGAACPPLENQ